MDGTVARVVAPVVVAVLLVGAGSALVAATTAGDTDPRAGGALDVGEEVANVGVDATPRVPRSERVRGHRIEGRPTNAQPSTDATVTRIRVHANGSATWIVEIRTRLANDSEVEAYRRFQERFRADTEQYLGSFRERMARLVDRAGTVTDREMRADGFTATTTVEEAPRRWGVVTYRFHWEGFAREDGDDLLVGDIFQSGYYLGDGDSMVVEAPEEHRIADVTPAPAAVDDATVRWAGPLDFADGRPAVRISPEGASGPADDGGSGPGPVGSVPLATVLTVLAVLLVGGVGGYLVLSGRNADADAPDPAEADGDGPAGSTDAPPGPADGPDPLGELATDEERVIALLERNGGRMRQADVADELDWSAPKTSRVLSSMAEDGDVEKLRIGNENVIDLPDGD